MTCPEWPLRTALVPVSGVLSGSACIVSGMSVERVRNEVRGPLRTHHTHMGCVCPGRLALGADS